MKHEYDFSAAERGRFYRKNAKLSFPAPGEKPVWIGPAGRIGRFIVEEANRTLNAYRAQPRYITEQANDEYGTAHGGYAHRQLFELVQNSADALLGAPEGKSILVRLTEDFLYCADDGNPIDEPGVVGLMFARMSSKRNTSAIGRFGLGFKSVLGVTDAPEFFSRPGSFQFHRARAAERIAKIAHAERYPVLRLPEPIDPHGAMNSDEELRELMSWATNVVRLPLKTGAHDDIARQIREFPPEFLLFVDHVRYLTLEDGEFSRDFVLHDRQDKLHLDTGDGSTRWRRFRTNHSLSAEAEHDRPLLNDSGDVPIWWAAPLERLTDPGQFWAFFPTKTASLVAGILNAPWKTNEDRQNLLPGPYNGELIEAAAKMIADELPKLATQTDPARHLDALPRRRASGDSEQSGLLRDQLFSHLREREVVPDQNGKLCVVGNISYPPKQLTDSSDPTAFECWAEYPSRPHNWLNHKALTRNRLATIDRLFVPKWQGHIPSAPRATIAEWLEALVKDQQADGGVRASMAAIQAAERIPQEIRSNEGLGDIVLTASGGWRLPDPEHLFLPDETPVEGGPTGTESCVHPGLVSDSKTLSALKNLGLKPPSPESAFRLFAERILKGESHQEPDDNLHRQFWERSRELKLETARAILRKYKDYYGRDIWPTKLRVRTLAYGWRPLCSVLLPGDIVPDDGTRDDDATVNTHFHQSDNELLCSLGATKVPQGGRNLSFETSYNSFRSACRHQYTEQDDLPHNPYWSYLDFRSPTGVGPLEVLASLSDEGRVLYTDALLHLDASFEPWTMRHTGTNRRSYPEMRCESLTMHMLRTHGRIRTPGGIVPLADALGPQPKNPEALHALLVHPRADQIKTAFNRVKISN